MIAAYKNDLDKRKSIYLVESSFSDQFNALQELGIYNIIFFSYGTNKVKRSKSRSLYCLIKSRIKHIFLFYFQYQLFQQFSSVTLKK